MKKKNLTGIIAANLIIGSFGLSSVAIAEVSTQESSEKITTYFEDGDNVDSNSDISNSNENEPLFIEEEVDSSVIEETNSIESDENVTEEVMTTEEIEGYELPSDRSDLSPQMYSARTMNTSISILDPNLPRSNFIDISSHNGIVTVEEFKAIKSYGVSGVSIKLTEFTSYKNPYALQQFKNAQAAGLKVSAYHYSWFTSEKAARTEAEFFVKYAESIGLPKSTLMVNDIEDPSIKNQTVNHTKNSQAFEKRLNELGYKNVNHYIGLYWINEKKIDPAVLGKKKVWVAAYTDNPTNKLQHTDYGAWQWTAKMTFPGVRGLFDMSSDYTGFYAPAQGYYINDGRHVKVTKKGYSTWSDFNWKYRDSTDNLYNQTFLAKGRYQHTNGNTYFSLYDNQGKWYGYLNANATTILDGGQGSYINDGRYVSISNSNYSIWSNFNFNNEVMNTNEVYQKTYLAKGRYEHFNGHTYYSLYDGKDKWVGYLDAEATKTIDSKNGEYIPDGRYVTVTNKNYNTWSNFSWKYRESGEKVSQKTYLSKGRYENINGSTYLSLYDINGSWQGYINAVAAKAGEGPQGIYIADGSFASMDVINQNLYSDFNGKVKQTTNNLYQKTLKAKGRYHHLDGTTYYSLYDHNNKWQGYANAKSVSIGNNAQGKYISYGKEVKITKKNYTMWGNFTWTKKKGNSTNYLNQKILAKGLYHHANGATYYSLYDRKGNWLGYINADATK